MTALYLTQILLAHDTAYKAGLRDSYDWHQKIWRAFPGRDGGTRDFLTRLDPLDERLRLLVLSQTRPTRPDWCPVPAWQSKEIPPSFLDGTAYRFSLVANPTRKTRPRDAEGKPMEKSQRVFITHREDRAGTEDGAVRPGLLSWFARKAEAHGFRVPDPAQLRTVPRPRQYFIKQGKAGLHGGVEFQGDLWVTEPEKFREAFVNGIGSAKAFGFGMLVLAPLD